MTKARDFGAFRLRPQSGGFGKPIILLPQRLQFYLLGAVLRGRYAHNSGIIGRKSGNNSFT